MVFDADVHLSVTEKNGLTAEEALRAMDRAGIDPGKHLASTALYAGD